MSGRKEQKQIEGSERYRGGHQYQHPANPALIWNAKGKKPQWLTWLSKRGKENGGGGAGAGGGAARRTRLICHDRRQDIKKLAECRHGSWIKGKN